MIPLFLFLFACDDDVVVSTSTCEIQITNVSPQPATPGDVTTVTGYPFTSEWDTLLTIDGEKQTVLTVLRSNCNDCDVCRIENGCLACQDCDPCDLVCKGLGGTEATESELTCTEQLTFEMPSTDQATVGLKITNAYGHSDTSTIEVIAPQAEDTAEN